VDNWPLPQVRAVMERLMWFEHVQFKREAALAGAQVRFSVGDYFEAGTEVKHSRGITAADRAWFEKVKDL